MTYTMATLTVRNVPTHIILALKALARRRNISMEQEVRELLEEHVAEAASVMRQIEASWSRQQRNPSPEEIESWIRAGRD